MNNLKSLKSLLMRLQDDKIMAEKRDDIQKYLKWESLSFEDKKVIWNSWNEYHKKAWETPSALLLAKQKEAYLTKDYETVKAIAEQARELRESATLTLKKPTSIDPAEFYGKEIYKNYNRLIKSIEYTMKLIKYSNSNEYETSKSFYDN